LSSIPAAAFIARPPRIDGRASAAVFAAIAEPSNSAIDSLPDRQQTTRLGRQRSVALPFI
jgi:hypothetical protein